MVQVANGSSDVIMGIVVDEVSEVLEISGREIEPAPSFGNRVDTGFILGIAKAEGAVKILLDLDRILCRQEIAAIAESNQASYIV